MAYISRQMQSKRTSHLGSFLTGCLAGAIIGGVLGVLLAPHRGDITRRKVARKAEEAKEQVIEVVENQVDSLKVQKEEENGDQEADS